MSCYFLISPCTLLLLGTAATVAAGQEPRFNNVFIAVALNYMQ